MDSATSLYRSFMRPFRNRPDIKIPGRWYWCQEGAQALPFWHAFGSYRQDSSTVEGVEYELGELPEWHGLNTHVANSRYDGQQFCGTQQDWQQGAIYGQTIELDAEGVPVCCGQSPLRPGGGAIVIKTPAFSISQAVFWLNPDSLQPRSLGDPVSTWLSSAGPPNFATALGVQPTRWNGAGVTLFANPPHGAKNFLLIDQPFTLTACSWYLVGGGALTLITVDGLHIQAGILPIGSTFATGNMEVAVSTNHVIALHNWSARAAAGLFSGQLGNGQLTLSFLGQLLASVHADSTNRMNFGSFLIGQNIVAPFIGAATRLNEFLLFDTVLTPQQDWTVLVYLARKWGFTLGPNPTYFGPSYFPGAMFRPWMFP